MRPPGAVSMQAGEANHRGDVGFSIEFIGKRNRVTCKFN